jgi:hypothetical protein
MFKAPLRHFQCKLPHHLCLPHWTGDWMIYQMVLKHPIVSRTLSIHDAKFFMCDTPCAHHHPIFFTCASKN